MSVVAEHQEKYCVARFEYIPEKECEALEIPNGSLRLTPLIEGHETHSEAAQFIQKAVLDDAVVIKQSETCNTDRPFYGVSEILEMSQRAQLSSVVDAFKRGE